MIKGFKEFIMRGNVVDLAVGIVIGAAFAGVVGQFTESFLEPLIRVISGGEGLTAGAFEVRGVPFDWAAFVNALIAFFLTAAALYFVVVLPMNKLAERRNRGQEPAPAAPSEEVRLLTEIRDGLRSLPTASPAGAAAPSPAQPSVPPARGTTYPPRS